MSSNYYESTMPSIFDMLEKLKNEDSKQKFIRKYIHDSADEGICKTLVETWATGHLHLDDETLCLIGELNTKTFNDSKMILCKSRRTPKVALLTIINAGNDDEIVVAARDNIKKYEK